MSVGIREGCEAEGRDRSSRSLLSRGAASSAAAASSSTSSSEQAVILPILRSFAVVPRSGGPLLEFLSPEWVDEARVFLERKIAQHGYSLESIRFSKAEVTTDPPPHLAAPGRKLGWALYLANGKLRVARGDHYDTLHRVELDYKEAVEGARMVYMQMELDDLAELYRARRDTDRLMREGGIEQPEVPTLLSLILVLLHDHMARRTMPYEDAPPE